MKRFLIFVFICFAALANAQTYTESGIPLSGTTLLSGDIVPNADNARGLGSAANNYQFIKSRVFESTTGQLLLRTTTASSMQFAINSVIVGNVFGSSGNWQLGASSPVDAGYKFDVQGTARFTGASVFENAVGIRNGTPETSLDVVATADAPIFSTAYSNGQSSGGVMSRRARGTQAAPLAVQANDLLGGVFARAHNGSNFTGSSNAGIYIYAAQNWTTSTNSTYVTIETTTLNSASRTEKFRITPDGAVGINQATPAASAILDIVSTNRGVLFPRMTQAQRIAIASPATGLIVYQTDGTEGVYVYKSGGWVFAF